MATMLGTVKMRIAWTLKLPGSTLARVQAVNLIPSSKLAKILDFFDFK